MQKVTNPSIFKDNLNIKVYQYQKILSPSLQESLFWFFLHLKFALLHNLTSILEKYSKQRRKTTATKTIS